MTTTTTTKICTRSGLKFETDNSRLKVHPLISVWTSHKDQEIRSTAIKVIDGGKLQGWDTIEQFQTAIAVALTPVEVEFNYLTTDCPNRKSWVALIQGQDLQYGYDRKFLNPVALDGRRKKFLITEDGIYQTRTYSGSGNVHENWLKFQDGNLESISQEQAIELVGAPADTTKTALVSRDDLTQFVEECWECGARYKTYGNVDFGNMGCRRCN
jgi:hypothetical protein